MVGSRMPDVDCGGTRIYELLREQKFVSNDVRPNAAQMTPAAHRWLGA